MAQAANEEASEEIITEGLMGDQERMTLSLASCVGKATYALSEETVEPDSSHAVA